MLLPVATAMLGAVVVIVVVVVAASAAVCEHLYELCVISLSCS